MSQRDDRVYVGHMVDIVNKAIGFVQGVTRENFDNDELLRISLTHLLQVIGEAARRVSPDFRAAYPQIDWKAIVGMRSKVVHDYLNVDEDIVWDTVINELPSLVNKLERILNSNNFG
jgi:uncharacterized protein with HEPN domain